MAAAASRSDQSAGWRGASYWAAFLIGIAVMAGLDEIVFHQMLGWHHFYDSATSHVALFSDGLLHAGELIALVAGFFLLADARRGSAFSARAAWAGFVVGSGTFQLWDGVIHHKVLRLHQIRYGVDTGPYDLAWNAFGLALLAVGIALTVRAGRRSAR